jgi:hypothetical protein
MFNEIDPTKGASKMKFMVLVKATEQSEAGTLPDEKALRDMGKFNESLVDSGMLLAGEGLHASAKGIRIKFGGNKPSVLAGPFTPSEYLVSGFWMIQAKSMDEMISVFSRCPPAVGEIEIRKVMEAEDFGPEFTPALREEESRLRERSAKKA